MDSASLLLILRWLVPLWLLGWLLLPLTRSLFSNLPDGGLAVGRTLAIVVISLIAFWLASLHALPLTIAPFLMLGGPLLCAGLSLRSPGARADFSRWAHEHRSALLVSDAVFLSSFLFFLWIRLRHPDIGDLEKSMDAALIAMLERAPYLPAQNPWFSGTPFTNYYYFGHLMGALLARTFVTPVVFSYNLIQPLFCALFIAPLWSLCAALTASKRRGLAAMTVVALCGQFEPLRQWSQHLPTAAQDLFRLDWWSTSRVIPDTINEYPIFTMTIGDAHGHFFALALASAIFCCCYGLFALPDTSSGPFTLNRRRALLLLLGALLGGVWMTNTWDLPIYGLLIVGCSFWTLPVWREQRATQLAAAQETVSSQGSKSKKGKKAKAASAPMPVPATPPTPHATPTMVETILVELVWAILPLMLARLLAAPYLRLFVAQISGVGRELYAPPTYEFLLIWGGFLMLWLLALSIGQKRPYFSAAGVIIAVAAVTEYSRFSFALVITAIALTGLSIGLDGLPFERKLLADDTTPASDEQTFVKLLALCGLLALLVPMLVYIRGVWGDGSLRHQDTIYKFGVQSWVLLGTAAACGLLNALARLRPIARWGAGLVWAAVWSIPLLCALCVVWMRTVGGAPRDAQQNFILSLDAAHHLTPGDHLALQWLQQNAGPDDTILEAVGQAPDGNIGGDFDPTAGRVAALTGIPDPVGWPQHIVGWGAPWDAITKRRAAILQVYNWPDNATALAALHQLGVRYVFVGATERTLYKPAALARLRAALTVAYDSGDTFIAEAPR